MIKVICSYDKGELKKIELTGHALANTKGHDLVCAGVSAIMIGGLNALEGFNKKEIIVKDGHIVIDVNHKLDDDDNVRLMLMIKQLTTLHNGYPKNIVIIKKGE